MQFSKIFAIASSLAIGTALPTTSLAPRTDTIVITFKSDVVGAEFSPVVPLDGTVVSFSVPLTIYKITHGDASTLDLKYHCVFGWGSGHGYIAPIVGNAWKVLPPQEITSVSCTA